MVRHGVGGSAALQRLAAVQPSSVSRLEDGVIREDAVVEQCQSRDVREPAQLSTHEDRLALTRSFYGLPSNAQEQPPPPPVKDDKFRLSPSSSMSTEGSNSSKATKRKSRLSRLLCISSDAVDDGMQQVSPRGPTQRASKPPAPKQQHSSATDVTARSVHSVARPRGSPSRSPARVAPDASPASSTSSKGGKSRIKVSLQGGEDKGVRTSPRTKEHWDYYELTEHRRTESSPNLSEKQRRWWAARPDEERKYTPERPPANSNARPSCETQEPLSDEEDSVVARAL